MSLNLIWSSGDEIIRGYSGGWIDGSAFYFPSFPGKSSETMTLSVRSSSLDDRTLETLHSVKFYLTGLDISTVQESWPYLSNNSDQNGGLEISFDNGVSFTRFSKTVGYEFTPSTWVTLPGSAVGYDGVDGTLGPFNVARFILRYKIPPQVTDYRLYNVQLAVDFDVI